MDIDTVANATAIKQLKNLKLLYDIKSLYVLPETLNCADLEKRNIPETNWKALMTIPQSFFEKRSRSGLLYSTVHIDCKALEFAIKHSSLIVLHYKFGDTVGMPKSYGIYKTEMNFLHRSNLAFLASTGSPERQMFSVYFPSPLIFENNNYDRLLIEYGYRWTKEEELTMAVVPFASFQNHTSSKNKFTVIPYIGSDLCVRFDSLIWTSPSALEAISRHFDTVVLGYGKFVV